MIENISFPAVSTSAKVSKLALFPKHCILPVIPATSFSVCKIPILPELSSIIYIF